MKITNCTAISNGKIVGGIGVIAVVGGGGRVKEAEQETICLPEILYKNQPRVISAIIITIVTVPPLLLLLLVLVLYCQ